MLLPIGSSAVNMASRAFRRSRQDPQHLASIFPLGSSHPSLYSRAATHLSMPTFLLQHPIALWEACLPVRSTEAVTLLCAYWPFSAVAVPYLSVPTISSRRIYLLQLFPSKADGNPNAKKRTKTARDYNGVAVLPPCAATPCVLEAASCSCILA